MKRIGVQTYVLKVLVPLGLLLLVGTLAPTHVFPLEYFTFNPSSQGGPYFGIAASPNGEVYVTVPQAHRVERYSSSGEQLGAWGSQGEGEGEFVQPKGIAVAGDGTVYVVDGSNGRIQYFTSEGDYLGQWGSIGDGDGQFFGPEHVAVAPNGDVYVTDYGNYRVQYFDRAGTYLGQWGSQGTGPGEFDLPLGIAVATDGTVYVSDLYNNRIEHFSAEGEYRGEWAMQAPEAEPLAEGPHGVSVGPDGSVYAAIFFESRVERYSPEGEYLGAVSVASSDSQLGDPQSVAFSDDGTMYVADAEELRVCSTTPKPDTTPPDITVPADIVTTATDASGTVVDFEVTAYDAVDGAVGVVADPPSGSRFPVGATTVVVTAEDSSGNGTSAEFVVSVSPMASEPSNIETSSEEVSVPPPPVEGSSDASSTAANSKPPMKNAYVWASLVAVTAFLTTRKRWLALMLGIGGLVAILIQAV